MTAGAMWPTNELTDLMRESMSVSLMAIGLKQSGLLPPSKSANYVKIVGSDGDAQRDNTHSN